MVHIHEMQFGGVPGKGTTDAIFTVRQLQEKCTAAKKNYSTLPSLSLRKLSIMCQGGS